MNKKKDCKNKVLKDNRFCRSIVVLMGDTYRVKYTKMPECVPLDKIIKGG